MAVSCSEPDPEHSPGVTDALEILLSHLCLNMHLLMQNFLPSGNGEAWACNGREWLDILPSKNKEGTKSTLFLFFLHKIPYEPDPKFTEVNVDFATHVNVL